MLLLNKLGHVDDVYVTCAEPAKSYLRNLVFFLRNGMRLIINLECFNEQINAFVQGTAHLKAPPLTKREILVLLSI